MKKLVMVIDIQNEYIATGRPFNITCIKPALENAKKIIDWARASEIPVWHIWHKQDTATFNKNNTLSDAIDGFQPINNEPVFEKDMYSCFSSAKLVAAVEEHKPEEIIIIGFGSSMCCLCTTIDGVHRGYQFTLIEDATASRSFPHASEEVMHSSAYNILKQYANVMNTSQLCA